MAHENFKIAPGVTQNDTPVLNEAGISFSSLIRFMYDPKLGGLTQKLGGWTKFYPTAMVAKVRALLAFEDTQSTSHLAVGTENRAAGTTAQLASIQNGGLIDITPTSTTDNVTPAASTTAGSALVVITDATTPGITPFDTVYIPTHISVGGLILFGLYQCDPDGAVLVNSYSIYATDKLGNLLPASSTTTTTAVMQFTTVSGSSTVKVTLPNHGFMQGDEIPILIHTTVGGITLYGHYYVGIVIDANNFNILASQQATASTSAFINSGNARFVYGFGVGALPASITCCIHWGLRPSTLMWMTCSAAIPAEAGSVIEEANAVSPAMRQNRRRNDEAIQTNQSRQASRARCMTQLYEPGWAAR